MPLFNAKISIDEQDRPRVDRALAIAERLVSVLERLANLLKEDK